MLWCFGSYIFLLDCRFATMPKPQRRPPQKRPLPPPSRRAAGTIDRYYLSSHCAVWDCSSDPQALNCNLFCHIHSLPKHGVFTSSQSGLGAAHVRLQKPEAI